MQMVVYFPRMTNAKPIARGILLSTETFSEDGRAAGEHFADAGDDRAGNARD
ncbi:MAG: hypothetical protein ABIP88_03135 [Candidatus Binatia bacterium]